MENSYWNRIRRLVLGLNLFNTPESKIENVSYERVATRFYLVSLLIVFVTVVIVSGCSIHTVDKTEYWPSQVKFEKLMKNYPQTLECPCSRLAVRYEKFVNANVEFHQVCSSNLVTQMWINSIYVQRNVPLSIERDDIRWTLSAFWQVVQGFCLASKQAWSEVLSNFGSSNIVHSNANNRQFVETTARSALNSSLKIVKAAFVRDLFAIERTIAGNELVSALSTNFYASLTKFGIKMLPRKYNDCSCSKTSGCPHSAFFINDQDELVPVPGMIADCLIVDSVLASTLECYYNRMCVSLLHRENITNVVPLSITLNKHFLSNSSIETLVNELMIDNLSIEISFDLFYSECNPSYCSYTYSHRFDVLFVITSVVGTVGGLSSLLSLVAQLFLKIMLYRKNKSSSNQIQRTLNRMRTVLNYVKQVPSMLGRQIISLNLFQDELPQTPERLYCQRIKTRLFLVLLMISVAAFGFYLFLFRQNEVMTISKPSVDTYKELYDQHSTNLKCPCSQLSVPYGKFVNINIYFTSGLLERFYFIQLD